MNGPVDLTGNFARDKLVKFSTQAIGTYGTILEAIAAAQTGQTVQVRDNAGLTPFADSLLLTKRIALKGGFAAGFGSNLGYTTTNGKLSIANGGALIVERIKIK